MHWKIFKSFEEKGGGIWQDLGRTIKRNDEVEPFDDSVSRKKK